MGEGKPQTQVTSTHLIYKYDTLPIFHSLIIISSFIRKSRNQRFNQSWLAGRLFPSIILYFTSVSFVFIFFDLFLHSFVNYCCFWFFLKIFALFFRICKEIKTFLCCGWNKYSRFLIFVSSKFYVDWRAFELGFFLCACSRIWFFSLFFWPHII